MPLAAPLRVPVEIRHSLEAGRERLFRLTRELSEDGLAVGVELPEAIGAGSGETVALRFHLPEDPVPLLLRARVVELDVDDRDPADGDDPDGDPPPRDEHDDRPRRVGLRFIALEETERARIARYVDERLNIA